MKARWGEGNIYVAGEALSEDKLCKVPLNFQISDWVRGKMNLELLELSQVHFRCSLELRLCLCDRAGQQNPFLNSRTPSCTA